MSSVWFHSSGFVCLVPFVSTRFINLVHIVHFIRLISFVLCCSSQLVCLVSFLLSFLPVLLFLFCWSRFIRFASFASFRSPCFVGLRFVRLVNLIHLTHLVHFTCSFRSSRLNSPTFSSNLFFIFYLNMMTWFFSLKRLNVFFFNNALPTTFSPFCFN